MSNPHIDHSVSQDPMLLHLELPNGLAPLLRLSNHSQLLLGPTQTLQHYTTFPMTRECASCSPSLCQKAAINKITKDCEVSRDQTPISQQPAQLPGGCTNPPHPHEHVISELMYIWDMLWHLSQRSHHGFSSVILLANNF